MNSSYRRLLPYALREWRMLLVIVGLTIGLSLAAAMQPWPMKVLVDHGLRAQPVPETLHRSLDFLGVGSKPVVLIWTAALGSLVVFMLGAALDAALSRRWAEAGQRMVVNLSSDIFYRLQRLSLLLHYQRNLGDSLNRIVVDTWSVYTLTATLLVSPVQQIVTLVATAAIAWQLDRTLALVILFVAPLLGGSSLYFGRKLKRRARSAREAHSRLSSFVQQTLSAMPLVQVFGTERRNWQRFLTLAKDAIYWGKRGALINSTYGLTNGLITTAGIALILYLGGIRVLAGALTVGGLLVFLSYIRTMQNAAQQLLQVYASVKPLEASIDRISEILAIDDPVRNRPGAREMTACRGHIRFENVTFGYERHREVLRGLTFEALPGQTVAIVGGTGTGKTTTASLVPRFFDPWEGRVTLDGIDVRDIRLTSLRQQISVVLQEAFLLPITIAENIAYGRPGASRDEIVAAAETANAHGFIERLADKYDAVLGERGATLSGGQRQRIAIARALLKNAPIVILDEPTSSLDPQTESLVMQAIRRLIAGRTTIVIAHRLSTIRDADKIVVLAAGAVAEEGTHAELLARNGLYHNLYSRQLGQALGVSA